MTMNKQLINNDLRQFDGITALKNRSKFTEKSCDEDLVVGLGKKSLYRKFCHINFSKIFKVSFLQNTHE